MNYLKYLIVGSFFGIVLAKAEIISWFRIYEMFRFESFHMYGIIGSAVILGAIIIKLFKINEAKDIEGNSIVFKDKDFSIVRYLVGGTVFGLGWALVGACPGPMFVLLGYGYISIVIVIIGALFGTFIYGVLRNKLPH
ncbi:MAG: putative membrane protein YedE/YeeE [Saprospiraceae bacterium]|jgi:uncharacterized membrane protein YedE/YeeE